MGKWCPVVYHWLWGLWACFELFSVNKNAQKVINNLPFAHRLDLQRPQSLPQLGVLGDYQAYIPSPNPLN